ncbi:hypothetical protein FHS16_001952 [Paenibacillus endophyticus]|uniref:C4-dicarboxylate ABC transporter n=1 Tax=Paenibacillus endophyticus TaxID=1294268 RepID=A0A7W5C679_9BACL|nr:hypothetical protein [Paenibacillus endophyticus]MBB3151906.1 hypothetical protein [Paenibacillus endophyticus]
MAPAVKAAMERTLIFSIAAVYIALQLTKFELLIYLLGGLVFVAIVLLLPKLKGMTLWLTMSFMVTGAVLLWLQKADARIWFESAGINVTIVTLFLFAPLFGIPVRLPAYVEALKKFYEVNLRSKSALFLGTQLLTQLMGVFINVGSIPVVYQLVYVKPQPGMNLLLANALNRGFAGAILWSPYFAAMTLVTSALGLPWSSVLPYMLGLAILSLFVSWLVDSRELLHIDLAEPSQAAKKKERAVFPFGLGIYLIAAIIVILAMERVIDLPMVLLICLAALSYPLLWCFVKGEMTVYKEGFKNHVTVTLPALRKEITLFLAAGFFSGSIGVTKFGEIVPSLLEHIPLPVAVTFSIFTVALIAGTSLIGLHPIVPVTILAGSIDPLHVQISPIYFAVLLLGSWALSNPISPASAVNNLLAGLLKKTVFEVAMPNYKFAACMALGLMIYLLILVKF